MFSRIAVAAAVVAAVLCGAALAGEAPAAEPRRATGCVPPGPAQREWERNNLIVARSVLLNRLGLERVNAQRRRQLRRELTAAEVGLAPLGREVRGLTAAAAARLSGAGRPAPAADAVVVGSLPAAVDNSVLQYFPPIGDQGLTGSCAQWASMYYAYTHMTAAARGWDAKAGGSAYRFSPKFTYNLVNGGADGGSWITDGWQVAQKHGCATQADFPWDGNYLEWPRTAPVWLNAISYRGDTYGTVEDADTDAGLALLKQMLADGYVLNFATYVYAWQFKAIGNDPGTGADDAFVGKSCCYWLGSGSGPHAMTVVGYNDDIWVDINGNGSVDSGEKGALRIANSWAASWSPGGVNDGGYTWLAYDALKATSAVSGGPSNHRQAAWWSNQAYWATGRAAYAPRMVAQFTLSHAKRNQLRVSLGISDTSTTTPQSSWYPNWVLWDAGGALAFDGSTTELPGTFVFDFSDLVLAGSAMRYYLSVRDTAAGSPATLSSYTLRDLVGSTDTSCATVPQTPDNATATVYVEYTYAGAANNPPVARPQTVTVIEDTPQAITLTGSDPEGEALTYTVVTPPANGTLSGTEPNLTYTPDPDYSGPDTFTFKVNDSHTDSAEAHVFITVVEVNEAPVIDSFSPPTATPTVDSGTTTAFSISCSDPDGDPLTYSWKLDGHTVSGATASSMDYSPTAAQHGAHVILATVMDNHGLSASRTWDVTVNAVPTASNASVTVVKNTAKDLTLSASDLDGNPLTYNIVSGPTHGTLTVGTGAARTYTPTTDYTGADSFTFQVNDGRVDSNLATVSITVSVPSSGGGGGGGGCALAAAPAGGLGVLGWAAPYAAVALGGLLARALRRRRQGA